jgi:hypothetical protein
LPWHVRRRLGDRLEQEWRVGTTTAGQHFGQRVQTDTLNRFDNHGSHYPVTSPAP